MNLDKYFKQLEPMFKLQFESLIYEAVYPILEVGEKNIAEGIVNGLVAVTNRILTHPRISKVFFNSIEFERSELKTHQLYFGIMGNYSTDANTFGELEKEFRR